MIPVQPLARTGAAPGYPLAGSRLAWFDSVLADGGRRSADTLGPEVLAQLTAERAAVCGLRLDRPRVMGILNVTPDSFSDGGDLASTAAVVARAREMAQSADILDIGGESTRPGAGEVIVADEIARVVPAIRAIRAEGIATPISVDTRKSRVAAAALEAGADMVNDVSALGFDPDMAGVLAEAGVPVCLMHSKGDPATMQVDPRYDDVVAEVYAWLSKQRDVAAAAGIAEDRILLDPGIGFGKTLQHNVSLLRALTTYHGLGQALLLGASRKRFIGQISDAAAAKDRLAGSLAVALHGAAAGVQILRVHDTRETRQALSLQAALGGQEHGQDV